MDDLKERNDLIRRGDAIDLCVMALDDSWEYDYATDRMFEIPAVDAVEVVRCRDCLRAEPHYSGSVFCACELLGTVRANDYCSWGQRREDGANGKHL